jgi:hypothetical protein
VSRRDEEDRRAWLHATFGVETWTDVALIGAVVAIAGAFTAFSLFYW